MGYEDNLFEQLQSLAAAKSEGDQLAVLKQLKGIRDRRMVEYLLPLLEEDSHEVVSQAVSLLAPLADPRALPHLERVYLKEKIHFNAYLVSLRRIGGPRILPHLIDLLEREAGSPLRIAKTIVKIDPQKASELAQSRWNGSSYAQCAALMLSLTPQITDADSKEVLKRFLTSQDVELLRDVSESLCWLPDSFDTFNQESGAIRTKADELVALDELELVQCGLDMLDLIGVVPDVSLYRDIYTRMPNKKTFDLLYSRIRLQTLFGDWLIKHAEGRAFVLSVFETHPDWLPHHLCTLLLQALNPDEIKRLQGLIENLPENLKLAALHAGDWGDSVEWVEAQLLNIFDDLSSRSSLESVLSILAEYERPALLTLSKRAAALAGTTEARQLDYALGLAVKIPRLCKPEEVKAWLIRGLEHPDCALFRSGDWDILSSQWPELVNSPDVRQAAKNRMAQPLESWIDIHRLLEAISGEPMPLLFWWKSTRHPDRRTACQARWILMEACKSKARPEVLDWLQSEEPVELSVALQLIHAEQAPSVQGRIIALLESPNLHVQREAIDAAGRLNLADALPVLEALPDLGSHLGCNVALACGQLRKAMSSSPSHEEAA